MSGLVDSTGGFGLKINTLYLQLFLLLLFSEKHKVTDSQMDGPILRFIELYVCKDCKKKYDKFQG
jgi:hypothetical protein